MKISETFSSATSTHVRYDIYLPTVMIRYKAIVQIHHALGEHCGRYERFAQYLAHDGFVVVVSDFPGHGTSLYNYEQGYFGNGDGRITLVEDMQRLRNIMANKYPDLPYFMIGNQFGSLVLRQYMARYGDFIQGAIIMGTCGKPRHVNLARLMIKGDIFFKGSMHRSKTIRKNLINRVVHASNDNKYLTSDKHEYEQYIEDPFTDFTYTNNAYQEIFDILKEVNNNETIKKIPNYLSILILSGSKDAFGRFGFGPKWFYQKLNEQGVRDVTITLYKDSCGDILHDQERLKVYSGVLDWLNYRTFD